MYLAARLPNTQPAVLSIQACLDGGPFLNSCHLLADAASLGLSWSYAQPSQFTICLALKETSQTARLCPSLAPQHTGKVHIKALITVQWDEEFPVFLFMHPCGTKAGSEQAWTLHSAWY